MAELKQLKINNYTKVLVPASSYSLENDTRLLIPFTSGEKIGFINNQGEIIVSPKYTMCYGDAYHEGDYIKVAVADTYGIAKKDGSVTTYCNSLYGLLDSNGKVVFEPIYRSMLPSIEGCDMLFTVQREDYQWGVIDIAGKEIVPFGKYNWIDGYDHGYTRVKVGHQSSYLADNSNKWGIINELGEEILPVEYDNIWNFYDKSRHSTRIEKEGVAKEIQLRDNPDPEKNIAIGYDYNDDYDSHYVEYEGSYAQDVMGYSDDVIDDAFDGDPDAYWNID
jgi:hypothetical protein